MRARFAQELMKAARMSGCDTTTAVHDVLGIDGTQHRRAMMGQVSIETMASWLERLRAARPEWNIAIFVRFGAGDVVGARVISPEDLAEL